MATVVLLVGYGLIFVIFTVLLVYFVIFFDSTVGNLDFISSRLVAARVIDIVKRQHLEIGNFYDLGSARGQFAARIVKRLPKLKVYGFDNSGFRTFLSKIRSPFFKNLKFKKQDIFAVDVSAADVVYLYLPQELMPALQIKLQRELKRGGLVISNSVSFPSWSPSETFIMDKDKSNFKKLFVYKHI